MEQSNLGKLELSVRKLRQELEQLSQDKLALHSEVAEVQQQLQGKEEAELEAGLHPQTSLR
jgi:centriolin